MVKSLIKGQDAKYGSPLHYAVFIGHTQSVKILLEHGANPNLPLACNSKLIGGNDDYVKGSTALDIARRQGLQDIIRLLLKYDGVMKCQNTTKSNVKTTCAPRSVFTKYSNTEYSAEVFQSFAA